jgi:hypothetical protein
MLGGSRISAQKVAPRVVLSSVELYILTTCFGLIGHLQGVGIGFIHYDFIRELLLL